MATPHINESYLVYEILKVLNSGHGQYGWYTRVNPGGVQLPDGTWFRTGVPAGYTDISGHTSNGIAVFIECKVGNNKVTEKQQTFIDERKAKGAIAGVCRSVEDALVLIGVLPPEERN